MTGFSSSTLVFTCDGFGAALDQSTDLTRDAVQRAIRSALNKVIKSVKSLVSAEIRKIYNVPKAVLDDRLTLFTARVQELEAVLVIGGKSIPLSYFGMRSTSGTTRSTVKVSSTKRGPRGQLQTKTMKRSASSGVSVEVIKGRRTQLGKNAFVATMRSGHIGVMRRGSGVMKSRSNSHGVKHRQQIYEKAVVSIASMFNKADVNDSVVAKIDADLERIFIHELEFYLGAT